MYTYFVNNDIYLGISLYLSIIVVLVRKNNYIVFQLLHTLVHKLFINRIYKNNQYIQKKNPINN